MDSVKIKEILRVAYDEYGMIQNPIEVFEFAKFLRDLQCENILEIGTFLGGTFYVLCKLSGENGKKISVDFQPEIGGDIKYFINKSELDEKFKTFSRNVKVLRLDSHLSNTFDTVSMELGGIPLDLLFIDGDHSYEGVKQDYETYKTLVKDGGYVVFHDINLCNNSVSKSCNVHKLWQEILTDVNVRTFEFNQHNMGGIGVVQVFKHKRKLNIGVTFESPGKIFITNRDFSQLNLTVAVRDRDTGIPIYSSGEISFGPNCNQWFIIPISNYIWDNDKQFSGFTLEFYDAHLNLVDSKDLKIKTVTTPSRPLTRHYSPFDCLYINYRQMFCDGIYDKLDIDNLDVVFDIGANVGIFSNYISGRGAKSIHSVEPTKKAFDELQKQFYYYNGVKCHKLGIGSKDGEFVIYSNPDNSTISSFLKKSTDRAIEERVRVLSLDSFYKRTDSEKSDLIKMDVEGMEYEIFGAADDSTVLRCPRYIIEYHPVKDVHVSTLIARFKKLSYSVTMFPDNDVTGYFYARLNPSAPPSGSVIFPKRAFVTFTNAYYLPLTEKLVKSVENNSKYPIIVYSINCDVTFKSDRMFHKRLNIECVKTPKFSNASTVLTRTEKEYNVEVVMPTDSLGLVDRADFNTYVTLSRKPFVLLDAIKNGVVEGIFLDADGIVRENIDTAFEYLNSIGEYPLVGRGLFEYMMLNGKGDPAFGDCLEKPLMDLLHVKHRSMPYVSTNFIVFTDKTVKIIKEWCDVSDDKLILSDNLKFAPYHDETILNVLLWKHEVKSSLPVVHYNVTDKAKVVEFYDTNKTDTLLGSEWNYVPKDKNDIKYFHGCKSPIEIDKILNFVDFKKQTMNFVYSFHKTSNVPGRIAIVTLFDDNYSELAKHSIPNKIDYAKKHGYDFIYFDKKIDNTRPAQWSKLKAVEWALMDYDWIWWIDIDALIMNDNIKLESIIDNSYDVIMTENQCSFISTGSAFFKNTEFTRKFLRDCYDLKLDVLKNVDINVFDHEQQSVRTLIKSDVNIANRVKLVKERVCNSFWFTEDVDVLKYYPDWNNRKKLGTNIYDIGDFVINFCGRNKTERIRVMKKFNDLSIRSYGGNACKFDMIDVAHNTNRTLFITDEEFWNSVYNSNKFGWWGNESRSGHGSENISAANKQKILNESIIDCSITSIVDFGCGDFGWMTGVTPVKKYIGVDIVKNLIFTHAELYGSDARRFVYGNTANKTFHDEFVTEFGFSFDVGLLFDILGHQTFDEIYTTLDFVLNKLNLKYLLVSNSKQCDPQYFQRKTSRNESIDIEIHPLMIKRGFEICKQSNDLMLYKLKEK